MRIATFALLVVVTNAFSRSSLLTGRAVTLFQASPLTSPPTKTSTIRSAPDEGPLRLTQQQLIDSYNRKIKALSTNKDRRAAEKAERLLREMMLPPNNLPPNQLAYTNAIVTWSRSRDKRAPHRAHALLQEMKDLFHNSHVTSMQPSKVPYTAVITAWSKSRDRNAGIYALQLLQEMKDANTRFCSPNAVTYGACISAVSGPKALELLRELTELYEQGDFSCRPDTIVYSSTIAALAKTKGNYQRAYDLLLQMERLYDSGSHPHLKPNSFSYSAALSACWDRFAPHESLVRADALVKHMQERYDAGLSNVSPNVVVYNSLLDVCSQCQSIEAAERALAIFRSMPCEPDAITYCTVITAFSRSGDARCGPMAVQLLDEMRARAATATTRGAPMVKPNTFVYGAAIAAQAKCGDFDTAQRLFHDMERNNCLPNTICYNSLISATSNDANRAYQLLQEMYRRYDAGERFVKPNTITYNTVLGAMAASSSSLSSSPPVPPQAAQAMLEDMKRRTAAGEPGVRPDHVTYSTLISIWTDSNVGFESSERVEVLLEEMSQL
jgi:pentatricopeptide repeat protein